MPELHLGATLLFLVPGLLAYCGFYGIFGGGKKVSVAPPPANSIEALTIILLASLFAHAATVAVTTLDGLACRTGYCIGLPDMATLILGTMHDGEIDPSRIRLALFATLVEGAATYLLVWFWLKWRTRTDRVPVWLYGWTAELANILDNPDRLVVAYVLTYQDVGDKSVVYAGAVLDMAVGRDGTIARITLERAERYLVAMDRSLTSGKALSRFELMTIERSNIRNIAFEPFIVADPAAPAAIAA